MNYDVTYKTLKLNVAKFISFIFPLFLILAQYKFINLNLGFVLFQGCMIVILLLHFHFKVHRIFFIFLFLIFFMIMVSTLKYESMYHGTVFYYINGFFLFMVVVVFSTHIKLDYLYLPYMTVGVLITLVVLLQGGYMAISGIEVAPVKLLPITADQERLWAKAPRPSGFFTEPQLYASFILPLFLLTALNKKYYLSFILVLGILFSGSTYGVMVILVLIAWLFISSERPINIKVWGLLLIFVILLSVIFYTTGFFDKTIEKLIKTDVTQGIRVAKAPILFLEMSLSEKVLGMGSTVGDFINQHINAFPWLLPYLESDSHLLEYVTGLLGLAIYYGLLPMLGFLWMLKEFFFKGDRFQQGMIIIIFLHSISATILFNGYFVFFFILLFAKSFDGTSKVKYWKFK